MLNKCISVQVKYLEIICIGFESGMLHRTMRERSNNSNKSFVCLDPFYVTIYHEPIIPQRPDGRMNRAFGRSGNPNLVGSNPGQIKPNTLKLILVASKPGAQHY